MTGCIRYSLLLVAFGLLTVRIGEPVLAYKWVDTSGKYSVEADFIALKDGAVKLEKEDGRIISIPMDKLDNESQEQAKQLAKSANSGPLEPGAQKHASKHSTETLTTSPSTNGRSSVTAEGIGATADEALKDAFRNAVRQVVGAVVDGETLVNNDDVIKEQVLTYSNGFIKSYKEIATSKRIENGLYRVTIMADVQRQDVIEKLKAANVTTTDVNGKDLFAKVVTATEAKNNATQLLKKALADLPTLLTVEVVGNKEKPDYDATTSEIVLTLTVKPDLQAYDSFVRRLEETLRHVAVAKDSAVIQGKVYSAGPPQRARTASEGKVNAVLVQVGRSRPGSSPLPHRPSKGEALNSAKARSGSNIYTYQAAQKKFALAGPSITEEKKNAWCIWVCSGGTEKSTLQWKSYVVEADKETVLNGILLPRAELTREGIPSRNAQTSGRYGRTIVSLQLVGSDQTVIIQDQFELLANRSSQLISYTKPPERIYLSLLRQTVTRDFPGTSVLAGWDGPIHMFFAQLPRTTITQRQLQPHSIPTTLNLFVAPYSFAVGPTSLIWQMGQTYPRRIKATLDELKKIETVRCKVTYTAGDE